MRSFKRSSIMNGLIVTTSLLFVTLMMASPVLAQTYTWWFYQNHDGRVVDGWKNGITYSLHTGKLRLSGEIWTAAMKTNPTAVQYNVVEVRKKRAIGSEMICTSRKLYVDATRVGRAYADGFSVDCGTIQSGSDYFILVARPFIDGREVEGTGDLRASHLR